MEFARESERGYSDLQYVEESRHTEGLQVNGDGRIPKTPEKYYVTTYPAGDVPAQKGRSGVCGIPLIWLVIAMVAFLAGGGIGGGIAAGVTSNQKKASTNMSSAPSVCAPSTTTISSDPTAISSGATATQTVNIAGCPAINGSTYASPASANVDKYQILCQYDITPGTDMNDPGVYKKSLDECLDACSTYNKNTTMTTETGDCLGVEWVIGFPDQMSKQGLCYFKNSTESTKMAATSNEVAVAGVILR